MAALVRLSVLLVAAVIVLLPSFSSPGYDPIRHSISELGAQGAPNAWVMRMAFILHGLTVVPAVFVLFRASRPFHAAMLALFALGMAGVALFSHRPIDPAAAFSESEDAFHSLFASGLGAAYIMATAAFALTGRGWVRNWSAAACALALACSALQALLPGFFGLSQRVLFAGSLLWICLVPTALAAPRPGERMRF